MLATFKPSMLKGTIDAPPSKSIAHRYLIGAALSNNPCTLEGIDFNEDILATIDCLKALGVNILVDKNVVTVGSDSFESLGLLNEKTPHLKCRESGSTLRFFIPLALTMGKPIKFSGSERLFERPLDIYEELCKEKGFDFKKDKNSLALCGNLESGKYKVRGDISSQFITGLIFALVYLGGESTIEILPPFESKSYVNLTISALNLFGAEVKFTNDFEIEIKNSKFNSYSGKIEGDFSNAAFLDAFNFIGSDIKINNLNPNSLQGDKVYADYFKKLEEGSPTLDISDCPDLGPILFALAALKNGATFTGTDRLKTKESDRGAAMDKELKKLGGGLVFGEKSIIVPKQSLNYKGEILSGHNDHRIVMALSVILSKIGGEIDGIEAVRKSYPSFFEEIIKLGAKVETK